MQFYNEQKRIRTKHKARGVAVVEFALLLVLLLIIVAGVVEFGRTFWYYDAWAKATRDGARFLSMSRVSTTVALDSTFENNAIAMVKNTANKARVPNSLTTDVKVMCDYNSNTGTFTDCTTGGYIPDYVTISVAYPVKIGEWIPFVTLVNAPWNVTLSPSTTMRYMCSEPESCSN
jgi:Flp pilus assembly protein TadG